MGLRRRAELGMPTLVLAGCFAAASARALPITVYNQLDLGADWIAASQRIGSVSKDAAASVDVALDVAPKLADLSIAPLEISFQRWDVNQIGTLNGAVAPPAEPDF